MTGQKADLERVERAKRAAGDAFWRFSLRFYASPGVEADCLAFQDQGGGDVNLLLFCLWCGLARGQLTETDLRDALGLSERWRSQAVAPLREIRRALKGGVDGLESAPFREKVKALELEAEQIQQRALAALALKAEPPAGPDAAGAMLDAYLATLPEEAAAEAAAPARRLLDRARREAVPLLEM